MKYAQVIISVILSLSCTAFATKLPEKFEKLFKLHGQEFYEEETNEAVTFLHKNFPQYFKFVTETLFDSSREEAIHQFSENIQLVIELQMFKEEGDLKAYKAVYEELKLENQSLMVAYELKQAKEQSKDSSKTLQLEKKLRSILKELLKVRLKNEEEEISMLEEELKYLKKLHSKRLKNQQKIIDRRFQELLEDEEALQW